MASTTPEEYLKKWLSSYIYAEPVTLRELDVALDDCLKDGREDGHSERELNKAAGGRLRSYLTEAISKMGES